VEHPLFIEHDLVFCSGVASCSTKLPAYAALGWIMVTHRFIRQSVLIAINFPANRIADEALPQGFAKKSYCCPFKVREYRQRGIAHIKLILMDAMPMLSTMHQDRETEPALDDKVIRLREWGTDCAHALPSRHGSAWYIGASNTCPLRLTDPDVSLRHAELFHERGQWHIRDLGVPPGCDRTASFARNSS
jgi:hypothetical protein